MNATRLLVKIATLVLILDAFTLFAQPDIHVPVCRGYVALCSTATSEGTCGNTSQDCHTCYGDDGSILANAPDCQ